MFSPRSVRFGTDSSQVFNLLQSGAVVTLIDFDAFMNFFDFFDYFQAGPGSCSAVEPVSGGERHHPVGPEGWQGPGQVPGDSESIPDICHGHTDGVRGEKICHVEKFQISVHDRCGEI